VTLKYSNPIMAPVEEGGKIGELIVNLHNNQTQQIVPLYTSQAIEKASWIRKIFINAKIKVKQLFAKVF
jgi:hypothetical protein